MQRMRSMEGDEKGIRFMGERKSRYFLFFRWYCLDDTIFSVIVLIFGGQVKSS